MTNSSKQSQRGTWIGLGFFLLMLASWTFGIFYAPVDAFQGEVYRIIYLHVPSAFSAFFVAFALFVCSMMVLFKPSDHKANWAIACAEVGLLMTVITLLTGMIWGKPTWNVYWTWDARLTTTLLLAMMYAGYLLLAAAMAPGAARDKSCAVLGILIFADVPIIYKSVTWWRTLHQPQTLLRAGGSTIDPEMRSILVSCIFCMLLFVGWMIYFRAQNRLMRADLERRAMSGIY